MCKNLTDTGLRWRPMLFLSRISDRDHIIGLLRHARTRMIARQDQLSFPAVVSVHCLGVVSPDGFWNGMAPSDT